MDVLLKREYFVFGFEKDREVFEPFAGDVRMGEEFELFFCAERKIARDEIDQFVGALGIFHRASRCPGASFLVELGEKPDEGTLQTVRMSSRNRPVTAS